MSAYNPYSPPAADLAPAQFVEREENTSGMGDGYPLPPGVSGWSWGAFLLNSDLGDRQPLGDWAPLSHPVRRFSNRHLPGGPRRELAWRNKRWASVDEFNRVQRKWSIWAGALIGGSLGLLVFAGLVSTLLERSH